jgi:hypothetical protein
MAASVNESLLVAVIETKAESQGFNWDTYTREVRDLHPVAWQLLRPAVVRNVIDAVDSDAFQIPMKVAQELYRTYQTDFLGSVADTRVPASDVRVWVNRLADSAVARLRRTAMTVAYSSAVWANHRRGPTRRRNPIAADPREGVIFRPEVWVPPRGVMRDDRPSASTVRDIRRNVFG